MPDTATFFFFFFNDTATTEIYTLSLHDALPISPDQVDQSILAHARLIMDARAPMISRDRKSTRLNSSHLVISYAVFCLKKKKKNIWFGALSFERRHNLIQSCVYCSLHVCLHVVS